MTTTLTPEEQAQLEEALAAPQPRLTGLPERMDRQAYLALSEHAKSLQLRLINYQQFIKDHQLEGALMAWTSRTEKLL